MKSNYEDRGVDSNFICASEYNKLKENYQNLIDSITQELEFYKTEQSVLRAQINTVVSQNQLESSRWKGRTEEFANYKNVTEAVIKNLNHQIQRLIQENKTLHSLWTTSQKTISILELEIKQKNQIIKDPTTINELKHKLEESQKYFETNGNNMKTELEKQKRINVYLLKNYKDVEEKLKSLEQKYNNLLSEKAEYIKHIKLIEQQLYSLKSANLELQNVKADLEKRLAESMCTVRESVQRETDALSKIQDLLNITDLAIADKNATLLREREIRDDCDHLASSIAEVFEEAANKVESDKKQIEKRYLDNIRQLEGEVAKMKVTQTQVSQNYSVIHQKNQIFEAKLKESQETNSQLDKELQMASIQIVDLELKLRAVEKIITNEKEANKIYEKRTQEFQDFLESKKRLNQRWKNTILELNEKFENEMKRLHGHIVHLQSANQKLKSQLINSVILSSNE